MSFASGRKSPTRNDGRSSPSKSNLVSNKSFTKNDLLMMSPIPISKGSRSNPNSPTAKAGISEHQKEYLQSLNGQIHHLESEFTDLLAVKEAVDHAKVHAGEEFDQEKATLLEQKEMEYLKLRKDRSSALFNLASEIKLLIEASPNHTAPAPRTPVRQGTSLDFNDFSSSSQNTPLKLSELSALASSDAGVHSRTVERILSKQNLSSEGTSSTLPNSIVVPPSSSSAATAAATGISSTFMSFPPQVYKPLDNKYLTSGQDSPNNPPTSFGIPNVTEVASPTTSDDDNSNRTAGIAATAATAAVVVSLPAVVAPVSRFTPFNQGFDAASTGGRQPSLMPAVAPTQGVYAANPIPLHATRSSNSLTNSHAAHHQGTAPPPPAGASTAATAASSQMGFTSSYGGGSQPAAPIFHAGGPGGGGGNVTSYSQGPAAASTSNYYPSSSSTGGALGAGGARNHPHLYAGRPHQQQPYPHHYQEHVYSSPPPPPPPSQQQYPVEPSVEPEEPVRFTNDEITKMLDHSNATTQQYLTLLQTQMKSLEIKHQTSENAILLRLAAVESRLEALESHHQATVAAHQEALSRMVPAEEFQALRATVESLADAFVKVQKQVSATQAQTTMNVHKSLGMRIMNGISNSLQVGSGDYAAAGGGGGDGVVPPQAVRASLDSFPAEDGNSVAPVQELSYRLEQLERTLIQERDAANRAMHDMMIQHQQQNRLEALEHRKEILELMKSNRHHSGPEYVGSSGPSSPAKSTHSAPAAVSHNTNGNNNGNSRGNYHMEMATLRERRKELLNTNHNHHNSTVTPIKPLDVDASEFHELDVPYSVGPTPSGPGDSGRYNPQVPHYSDDPAVVNPDLFHHQILNPDTIRVRPNAAGYLRSIKAIPPLPQLPLLPSEVSTPVAGHSGAGGDDAMYSFNHMATAAVGAAFGNSRATSPALTSSSSHARTSRSTTPTNIKPVVPEYHYETLLQTNSRLFPTFPQGVAAATTPSGPVPVKPSKKIEENRPQSAPSTQQQPQQQTLQPHNIKATATFMQPTSSHQIKLWSKK